MGLALLMDELAHGILVTGLDGHLLHANQAARHELARRHVLHAQGSLVQVRNPDDGRVLQDALAKIAEGKRSLITLTGTQRVPLTIAVLPLQPETATALPRAAMMFARASVCESLMLCFFARSHGLTATEESVLGILCQGYSAPQVAVHLKVAVSTVRSHVRSLCAKTRSSGVRELVNRVAVLPPVAPAFWREPMH
ncbi:MAG: LuxR family transcriptional regulator [Burkholderiales bacterium]|nr:MAG: LuxR family transcriptional regulator [Burkholderiales bacterium]